MYIFITAVLIQIDVIWLIICILTAFTIYCMAIYITQKPKCTSPGNLGSLQLLWKWGVAYCLFLTFHWGPPLFFDFHNFKITMQLLNHFNLPLPFILSSRYMVKQVSTDSALLIFWASVQNIQTSLGAGRFLLRNF